MQNRLIHIQTEVHQILFIYEHKINLLFYRAIIALQTAWRFHISRRETGAMFQSKYHWNTQRAYNNLII